MEKAIEWAVKNQTVNFVDASHVQVEGCSNSWSIQPLKDIKIPSLNRALDW